MPRLIKPFDDSQQKDLRRADVDQSTDTSSFDPYRQGVELTRQADYVAGIVKIRDGYNDEPIQHDVSEVILGLGQTRNPVRDEASFQDAVRFDPVAWIQRGPRPIPYDPAQLLLSAWWRDFDGSGSWPGMASAGTSGAHALSSVNGVQNGDPLNGHSTAALNGTNYFSSAGNGYDITELFGAGTSYQYSYCLLFKSKTASASTTSTPYLDTGLTEASDGGLGTTFTRNGFGAYDYDGGAYDVYPQVPASKGEYHLAQVSLDDRNMNVRVDDGDWKSVPLTGARLDLTGLDLIVGANYVASAIFEGEIAEIMIAPYAVADRDFDGLRAYFDVRYFLGLNV